MALIVFLVLLLGLIGWLVLAYNRLVALRNHVRNAWRQIDVQLKRRHDLIPNLVESVKDYMRHEQDTLRSVVEARSRAVDTEGQGPERAQAAESLLSGALGKLFALMENYPDLKADQSVAQLMDELSGTENQIGYARQAYNDSVMTLNNAVESVPSNIVAGLFGFRQADYFEVGAEARVVPRVSLR
ncbi:LemA family protein [Alkalilimnicola sp. S0819]|nr:LemA family protein [Alkalilimnicola sp. S0819]MPQ17144.1 LemA family protein [Alkalilimnicola sp. S0819]